jgi:hypothetical protein
MKTITASVSIAPFNDPDSSPFPTVLVIWQPAGEDILCCSINGSTAEWKTFFILAILDEKNREIFELRINATSR